MASINASLRQAWNDRILKYESNNSEYKCTVCDKVLVGEALAVDHLKSKRHCLAGTRKALTNVLNSKDNPPSLQQLLPPIITIALNKGLIIVTDSKAFKCKRCNVDISGVGHLEGHLKSSDHRKARGTARQHSVSPAPSSPRAIPVPCDESSGTK